MEQILNEMPAAYFMSGVRPMEIIMQDTLSEQAPTDSSARAIRKAAPAVLFRCCAANFAHKMALRS